MSVNFDALRKKLNTLQGQNDRSKATWKPTEGKATIRLVPWKDDPENPFIELYFHYLGGKTQLSPRTFGNPDPIAEFADKLRETNDKDDWSHARNFTPKLRTYAAVVVRGEEEQGVRFYGFGKTVYESLCGVILDSDWGDITDVESGHDIGVVYTPKDKSDTNFAKTDILVKPKETPLSKDSELVETWLKEQPDIHEIFTAPSYDELESFLKRYLNPDGDESVTTEEKSPVKKQTPTLQNESRSPKKEQDEVNETSSTDQEVDESGEDDNKPKDVAQEFAELFDD